MRYTLWSHGRLLGESPLDYARIGPRYRIGDLHPTPYGEQVLPVAASVSPAMTDLWAAIEEQPPGPVDFAEVARATGYADLRAATDRRERLELELRGPGGVLIPTEWIDVRDTEYLRSLIRADAIALEDFRTVYGGVVEAELDDLDADDLNDLDDVDDADDLTLDLDDDGLEPWEAALPKYQLQVLLVDDTSVP